MKYKITCKTDYKDKFNSSMNFLRYSKTFYFDAIFTIIALAALIYTFYSGIFFNFNTIRKILIIICPLVFPVIQPIVLYVKAISNSKNDKEVTLSFDDENIVVESGSESVTLKYINIYNFIKFKNMIVLMYDSIHGQIISDRFMNFDKEEFYKYVSERINYARKVAKEQNQ